MAGWFFVLMLIIYRKFFRIVEKGKEKRTIVGVFVIGLIIMLGFAIATALDIAAFCNKRTPRYEWVPFCSFVPVM